MRNTEVEVTDIFKRKLEQKICGFGLVVIGLLSTAILKDGTFACLAVPFGLWAMTTKKNLLSD